MLSVVGVRIVQHAFACCVARFVTFDMKGMLAAVEGVAQQGRHMEPTDFKYVGIMKCAPMNF
jgi:hypothetical protein